MTNTMTQEEKAQALANGLTEEQLRAVEEKRRQDEAEAAAVRARLNGIARRIKSKVEKTRKQFDDLSNERVFEEHGQLLLYIADEVCLAPQYRKFEVDEYNKKLIRFLLYYFNNCPLAEEVFPEKGYKLSNNLLIMGRPGAGKTLLMQLFSKYLKETNNPNAFENVSVTQLTNYFSLHNHIDLYTYNEAGCKGFEGKPMNICLNDIGVENKQFYNIETNKVVSDLLYARSEIHTQTAIDARKFAHLTTNLTQSELLQTFNDRYGRLPDRFKTYNIITLRGESRR